MKTSAWVLILLIAGLNLKSLAQASDNETWAGPVGNAAKVVASAKKKIALTSNCKGLIEILTLGAAQSVGTDGAGELRNSTGTSADAIAEAQKKKDAAELSDIERSVTFLALVDSFVASDKDRRKMKRLKVSLQKAILERVAELARMRYCHGIEKAVDEAEVEGGGEGGIEKNF